MSLVKEYFPDVPEQCEGCPALFAMASEVADAYGITAAAAEHARRAEDWSDYQAAELFASMMADIAQEEETVHSDVARNLWEHCSNGPIETEMRSVRLRRKAGQTACGSLARLDDGIPGSWEDL